MVCARIDGFLLDLVPRKAGLDAARGDWSGWDQWGQRVRLHLKCARESILYVMCYGPASRRTSVSHAGLDEATDWISLLKRRKSHVLQSRRQTHELYYYKTAASL